MKSYLPLFSFILILCSCAVKSSSDSETRQYELIWEENFNSHSLDENTWSKIPRGTPDWKNYMSDFEECYDFRDSNLVLRGIRNLPEYNLKDTAQFLTGGVYTKGKRSFENGRLDIRARIDGTTGSWPAIWMLPEEGQWPLGGEIDIMERLHRESIAYQTIHTHYTYNLKQKHPPQGTTAPIDPDGYNIYSVELGPDSLRFFINHHHTFTYPRIETNLPGQYPFDQPYYLLIDMQLGGNWVGEVIPEELPAEMWVDWVRFYRKK